MENYDEIISLGYVCNVPELLSKLKRRQAAYPFDRVGTPMWAVHELLDNDFKDFLLKGNITSDALFDGKPTPFVYDSKYYTRLIANSKLMNDAAYDNLVERMRAREQRIREKLESGDKILFIRSEEPSSHPDLGDRIIKPQYAEKYAQTEHHYLNQLSDLLKERYPSLQFKILFLNSEGNFIDTEHNIVGIPVGPSGYSGLTVGKDMKTHIDTHKTYIDANL